MASGIFTGGLDTRLPLAVQTPNFDIVGAIQQGMQLGNQIKGQVQANQQQKAFQSLLNDPSNRDEQGNFNAGTAMQRLQQSGGLTAAMYSALNDMAIQQTNQQALKQKNALEAQKTNADIGKTSAETTGLTQNNALKQNQGLAKIFAGAPTLEAARGFLTQQVQGGLIRPEMADSIAAAYLPATEEEFQQRRGNFGILAADDPSRYLIQSADNIGDNNVALAGQQNQANLAATNQANQNTRFYYGQDQANQRLGATLEARQNAAQTAAQAKATSGLMERQLSAQQAAAASQSAARASQAAATLINHPGLSAGTGWTAMSGKIPSTEGKAFQTELENLKSQLFLPMVQQMKGMGALSNAEGQKLEAAVQNLDSSVSPAEMQKRLSVVAEIMNQQAQLSSRQAQIYANGGRTGGQQVVAQPVQAQPVNIKTASLAQAKQAASKAGVSLDEMIGVMKSQGISVK